MWYLERRYTKDNAQDRCHRRKMLGLKFVFAENQNILSQCIHFKMEMQIKIKIYVCCVGFSVSVMSRCYTFGNKCTKFQSENNNNNKRAETGFMVEARGKCKPLRNVMGLLGNVSLSLVIYRR